jgi:TonB family protein
MRANSPSAFFASLSLHGLGAMLIVAMTWWMAKQQDAAPVIFELVAGEPTAPDELVAPARGSTSIKVDLPKVHQVQLPEQKEEAPVEPVEKPKPTEAKPDPQRVSYDQFRKQHGQPKETSPAPPKTVRPPKIDTQGIPGGVTGGSTTNTRGGGGGTALARQEQGQLETYIAQLMGALRRAHEKPPRLGDQLEAKVTFEVAANGNISDVLLSRSSGNEEFDQSALDAFRQVSGIGPTPTGKGYTWTVTFRMKDD